MAEQYWVGDFFVDLTRNQITQQAQSKTIPPKALAVLTCLARNVNTVVSHDEILSSVWPDTVVTPNTLQRSIAQLRKALGENSQSYIKTHAKQGYSLEVEVRWQDQTHDPIAVDTAIEATSSLPSTDSKTTIKTSNFALRFFTVFAAIALFAFIGFKTLTPPPPLKLNIEKFNLLTATDHKEYGGIYSPDGKYVVFQRYSDTICRNNNIWAKNVKTQKETQLTKNMAAYGSHSFSKDGKNLVFIESDNCQKPISQKRCYKLMHLDFTKALKNPQSPNVLVECKNSRIARPKWLNNNNILLVQEFSNRWKLTSYSITDNQSEVIFELDSGNIIYFDYSAKDDLIALTRVHSDGHQYLDMLKANGQVLSSEKINLPEEIQNNKFIYPKFTPHPEQLIFSTGRQLFTLSYDGEVSNISLPLDQPISSPIFHPDHKKLLVIKGYYDSDIALMPLSQIQQTQRSQEHPSSSHTHTVIERSIQGEENAQFQPQGKLIAYISARSGDSQLWVTDGKNSQQLTHFPIDTYSFMMDWATDGQSILVNANKKLTQIFLDSSAKIISFEYPVEKLYQWNSDNNTALAIIRIKGETHFAEIDLNNAKYKIMSDKKITWALKSDDGRLIYIDHMDQFWQSGPVEDQRIEALINQGSDKGLLIKDNVIYGINEKFQLWSYALNDSTFNVIGNVPEKIDELTDINQTDILLTLRIAAKKEVAEIILAN